MMVGWIIHIEDGIDMVWGSYGLMVDFFFSSQLSSGSHNDSRMNMALIMSAVHQGAVIANHMEVVECTSFSLGSR